MGETSALGVLRLRVSQSTRDSSLRMTILWVGHEKQNTLGTSQVSAHGCVDGRLGRDDGASGRR